MTVLPKHKNSESRCSIYCNCVFIVWTFNFFFNLLF